MRNLLLSLMILLTAHAKAADYVPRDVVWTAPSRNSSESMPCGGHDIGMNVWVEKHGGDGAGATCCDVLFYAQQSGWFDENNTLLKAGRWRLHVDGDPFGGSDFRQRLCLDEGCIYISGGGVEVRLWADVFEPVIFAAIVSQQSRQATLSYESWRYRDRPVTKAECQQCSYKWLLPKDCMTFADSIERPSPQQILRPSPQQTLRPSPLPLPVGRGVDTSTAETASVENSEGNGNYSPPYREGQGEGLLGGESVLRFWHKNRAETVFDFTVHREQLDAIKDSLYNPIGGLLMEGEMYAPGFRFTGTTDGTYASTDYRAWNFRNEKLKEATISIYLRHSPQPLRPSPQPLPAGRGVDTSAPETYDEECNYSPPYREGLGGGSASARWWHAFWQRSWIESDTQNDSLQAMIRNYELMRYMLACNAYGQWPTKFNGGLFTFDPVFVDSTMTFTPDYRKWGGGTMTAQNQRLVYWPMLRSGDYDMMAAQIGTYYRMLPNATARTRHYWGHGGASFTEQIENFGLPNPAEYGKHPEGTDPGVERNAWLEYQWDTALEFALMELLLTNSEQLIVNSNTSLVNSEQLIVNSYGYNSNGKDNDVMQRNEQSENSNHNYSLFTINYKLAEETLRFFDEHYRWQARRLGAKELDEQGHLIIYPGSACETYKMAYNPSSTIAGLIVNSEKLIANSYGCNQGEKTAEEGNHNYSLFTKNYSLRIPDIPLRVLDGDTCIAPAVAWARIQNTETPQLYPVWPWRLYGLGRPGLDIARNTYWKDPHAVEMRSTKGWKQDNIWAACLGLTDEARRLNLEKLCDGPYRFTAFYDPGFDWAPDHNRGGAGMIGLQEMLLQEAPDGHLLLFPAWPREWNCHFRLYTLDGRTVEASIENGKISLHQ